MIAKFRGRDLQGKWRYGSLVKDRDNIYIFPNKRRKSFLANFNKVNPETVGQWTGLKDKNGVEIYTGDKVPSYSKVKGCDYAVVELHEGAFKLKCSCGCYYPRWKPKETEVIGTIHDQKEREE